MLDLGWYLAKERNELTSKVIKATVFPVRSNTRHCINFVDHAEEDLTKVN